MVLGSSPVAVTSTSDFAPASSKEFLDIQETIECGFTLKRVRDMTRRYNENYIYGFSQVRTFRTVNSFNYTSFVKRVEKNNIKIYQSMKLAITSIVRRTGEYHLRCYRHV